MDERFQSLKNVSLWSLSWPGIIAQASFALRAMADLWAVGNISTDHLAAIMPAQYVLLTIQVFGMGLLYAVNPLAAREDGRGHYKRAAGYCWNGIWVGLGFGFLATLFYFVAPGIFGMFGHPQEVLELEIRYFRTAIFAIPPLFVGLALTNFFCGIGQPVVAMWAGIGSVFLTLGFNEAFIFGIPGVSVGEGIQGAGFAMVASNLCWASWLFIAFRARPDMGRFAGARPFYPRQMKKILARGTWYGAGDVAEIAFWSLALVWLAGKFGKAHLAATGVVIQIYDLISIPAEGIGIALATRVAANHARSDKGGIMREVRNAIGINAVVMLPIGILCFLLSRMILQQFSGDGEVIRIGVACMVAIPILLVIECWSTSVLNGLIGVGDARWPFLASLTSNILIIPILGSLMVQRYADEGSIVIWIVLIFNRSVIASLFTWRLFLLRSKGFQ